MNDDSLHARPVGALVQSLRILRHLAAQGTPEGVSAIARSAEVNVSTCFNILRTMTTEGLVVFDAQEKTYRLGMGLVDLAVGVLATNPGDLIRPELERMALRHRALMCLWHVTDNDRIVLIDSAFDPDSIRVDLPKGKRLPALIGGVGRVVAALRALPEDDLRRRFAQLRWQDPPSFDAYLADVQSARSRGYALDCGNLYTGVDVVAAVVCDHRNTPRYGLSSVTLTGQTTPEARHEMGRDLATTCARIGAALFSALPDRFRVCERHSDT